MQAYDFVELYKREKCILQMGGSDQWGNIVNGIDLGRRMMNAQLFALTAPLITTSSGAKMGKTAAGAVWLNADMVSPYDYWQYWRNTEDGDVARFLKLFTVLPLDEIAQLAALKGQEINEAKKVLATEATAMVHGRAAADAAAETARKTFEEGALAEIFADGRRAARADREPASACQMLSLPRALPSRMAKSVAPSPITQSPSMTSASAAQDIICEKDITPEGVIKLSLGKKRHVLLRPEWLSTRLTSLLMVRSARRARLEPWGPGACGHPSRRGASRRSSG